MAKDLDQDMDYGDSFISITDEEGNEFDLELLDTVAYKDNFYMCFVPADLDENDDDYGLIILRPYEDENGDSMLASVDDDDELDAVYDLFMERMMGDEEEAEAEEDET